MNEQTFDEKQSLSVIQEMIRQSRQNFSEGAVYFLIWGWAVLIASVAHYIVLAGFAMINPSIIWSVTMISAGLIHFYTGWKDARSTERTTFADRVLNGLWGGSVGMFAIVITIGIVHGFEIAIPLFIAVYGWGAFTSGFILQFTPFKIGGLLNFVIAVVALFVPQAYLLLILCVAILTSYLIPGYMLKNRKAAS